MLSDVLAAAGLLLVAAGAALVYPPAGVIVLGAETLTVALGLSFNARKKARR